MISVPELITMFPVLLPPIVSVLLLSDWIVELSALIDIPFPLVVADIVAIGVPLAIPVTANWED